MATRGVHLLLLSAVRATITFHVHSKCVAKVRVIRGLYAKVLCDALHHFERLLQSEELDVHKGGSTWQILPRGR